MCEVDNATDIHPTSTQDVKVTATKYLISTAMPQWHSAAILNPGSVQYDRKSDSVRASSSEGSNRALHCYTCDT